MCQCRWLNPHVTSDHIVVLLYHCTNRNEFSDPLLRQILCIYCRINFSPMADASTAPSLSPIIAGLNSEAGGSLGA